MLTKFAAGQKVKFNKRCVLASNVPTNTRGYTHMALISKEGDPYTGAGIIEAGTVGTVVEYAAHGTTTTDNPVILVNGILTRVHQRQVDPI